MSYSKLQAVLRGEEGYSDAVYLDTMGIPTGGTGHAFKVGSILPEVVWLKIFRYDVGVAECNFQKLNLGHLSSNRQIVVISMIYQLGLQGFRNFRKTRRLLRARRYEEASVEMLDSKWAREDTPARAKRMSEMMRKG